MGGRRLHDHLCGLGVGGGLVDRYGRRGALLIGLAVFGCATAVRGIVDSAGALIAVRAVMGGAALLLAAMLSIISSLCIDRESGPGDWARGDDRTRVWWSHRRDQGAPDAATAVSQQKIRPAAMNRGESGGLTGAEDGGDLTMSTPTLGSVLLATTNEVALRDWYVKAFGVAPNADGFLDYGGVSVLIDRRDDVADRSAEPERVILNFHVDDARAVAAHLDSVGVTWVVPVEFRGDAWFATLHDPDGNLIQIIELTPSYWATRGGLLAGSPVASRLPAQDLDRARRWYADKLGLEPVEERQGGLRYECGGVSFALFESAGKPSGAHTQMGWEVADIDATVTELRARGVLFEEYDLPGLQTVDGIADIEGNYPSKGTGERAVWFHDSEGNLIGLGQPVRATN